MEKTTNSALRKTCPGYISGFNVQVLFSPTLSIWLKSMKYEFDVFPQNIFCKILASNHNRAGTKLSPTLHI